MGYTSFAACREVQYQSKTRYNPQRSIKYENTVEALDQLEVQDPQVTLN